ncbi:MAG TPA: hypothetical protein VF144_11815 [Chitinophagaceae bacterium]
MKTTVKQSVFTASFLFAIVIVFNSFTVAQKNSMAKGGGIADGIHFSFTVIGQQNGNVVGHMNYGDETYSVVNAEWFGASAILYTDAALAFFVADNGGPSATDWITDPIPGTYDNRFSPVDFYGRHNVTNGNIQVK